MTFARIAQPIIQARGLARALTAFLAGAASTLGLEPVALWPALFITFPVLVWLLDGVTVADWRKPDAAERRGEPVAALATESDASLAPEPPTAPAVRPGATVHAKPPLPRNPVIEELKRSVGIATPAPASRLTRVLQHIKPAAVIGWWFGFGYFLAGLYWLGFALLVDAASYIWFLPFAVIGVPAGLALFTAFATALARLLWTRGALRVLTLAAALTIAEWLRGHVLTGFPWNTFGYALADSLWLAQASALVGIWSLTFIAVAVFASPAVLADAGTPVSRRFLAPILAAIVLIALAGYGAARLAAHPTTFVDGVELRVMQPDLQQDARFNYSARADVMTRYVTLSKRPTPERPNGMAGVTHLIWPESAFPFLLAYEGEALAQIVELLPAHAVLITGAVRASRPDPDGHITRAYNSIYVLDHEVSVPGLYDKMHLVPFGEYLPFQDFMERLGIMQLTKVRGGFIPGKERKTLRVPGAPPALPLICYEIIFPDEAHRYDGERPSWIVNVTNDGWFGNSSGPYQHFQQARVRAIEFGLPLVRAANTGISAVVDPLGRVVASLPVGVEGVLNSKLPQPLPTPLYSRIGDIHTLFVVGATFAAAWLRRRRDLKMRLPAHA